MCPASPALEDGVPACRQAGRGTIEKRRPYREAPPFRAGSFTPGDDAEGRLPLTLRRKKATQISKNALLPNPR